MQPATYYGAPSSSDNKSLGERLRDYYQPDQFVTVQNIDNKPLSYQFMDPKNEQFTQSAPYNGETYQTAPPSIVTLQPGQTKLCPAFEADRMLETLIKQITSSKTARLIKDGTYQPWQAANWSDPQTQTAVLKDAFLGVEDLVGQYNKQVPKADVSKDLDITNEPEVKFPNQTDNPIAAVPNEPARRGRPRQNA